MSDHDAFKPATLQQWADAAARSAPGGDLGAGLKAS